MDYKRLRELLVKSKTLNYERVFRLTEFQSAIVIHAEELLDRSEKLDKLRNELVDIIRHAFGNQEDSDIVYQDLRKMLDLIESSHKKTETEKQPI